MNRQWQNKWQKSKSELPKRYYRVFVALDVGVSIFRYYSAKYPSGARDMASKRQDVDEVYQAEEITKEEYLRNKLSVTES